jgi:fumarate reductase subunit D
MRFQYFEYFLEAVRNMLELRFFENVRNSWIFFLYFSGVSLTLAFTALEPASSQGLDLFPRLAFWAVHNAAAVALLLVAQLAISRSRRLGAAPPVLQVMMAGLLGAALLAPVALALDALFAPFGMADVDDANTLSNLVQEFVALAPPLLLIWGLLNAPRLFRLQQDAAPAGHTAGDQVAHGPDKPPALSPAVDRDQGLLQEFWDRVPGRLGKDIVALTAELHYLRVYTSRGDALIFMAFGRAVEALEAERGFQIHRSHWVALAHVVDVEQEDGRLVCVLDTGLRLPVSRANRAAFRAAIGKVAEGS